MNEIESAINNLDPKNGPILFIINSGHKFETTDKVVKAFIKKSKKGIYLSRDIPSKTLIRRLGERLAKKILFIDCVSVCKNLSVRKGDVKIDKGVTLPEVAYVISQTISKNEKYGFLHFDSLTIIFDCFSELDSIEFLNFLAKKLKSKNIFFVASTLELPKDEIVLQKVSKIFKNKIYLGF